MRLFRAVAMGVVALVASAGSASAQLSADSAALVDRIFTAINRTDGPGCAVGVNRAGVPVYRRGFGMGNLETLTPITANSVIESGSVGKQFTAGAIALLAIRGKLDLDDPIQKYIPELPKYEAPVTLRMALHHTSGVRDMWTLFALTGQPSGKVLFSMEEALRIVYRQKALNFTPNAEFLYSNGGYLLLAEVVHRVSGKTLAEFSREEFFEPLGMTQTQWRDDWNRVVPGRTTAYSTSSGTFRTEMPLMSVYGAGGLLTTVGDVLKWTDHFDQPTIGGQKWVDMMHTRGRLNDGKEIAYALGLFVTEHKGIREISHGGATGGYRTFLGRWPDRRLSIAVFCNVDNANPDRLAHEVADVFLGTQAIAAGGGGNRPPQTAANSERPAPATAAELARLTGSYYSDELDVTYTVGLTGDTLTVAVGSGKPQKLVRSGADSYRRAPGQGAGAPIELAFTRAKGGRADGFVLFAGRVKNLRFTRR